MPKRSVNNILTRELNNLLKKESVAILGTCDEETFAFVNREYL
jgi:hypothetical protein